MDDIKYVFHIIILLAFFFSLGWMFYLSAITNKGIKIMEKLGVNTHHSRVLYLNNNGSRWIILENGQKVKVKLSTGEVRTAIYFEQFGNHSCVCVSLKGVKIKTLDYTLLEKKHGKGN